MEMMTMTVDTKELDRRISIEKCVLDKDEKLNEIKSWSPYYSCYAGLLTSEISAAVENSRLDYNTEITFKVRYCVKAKAIRPELYRIIYDGQIYNIKSAVDVNGAHMLIRIKAVIANEQH